MLALSVPFALDYICDAITLGIMQHSSDMELLIYIYLIIQKRTETNE